MVRLKIYKGQYRPTTFRLQKNIKVSTDLQTATVHLKMYKGQYRPTTFRLQRNIKVSTDLQIATVR